MKKKILAFVLTTLLVCQLGVVAFADETTVVVEDNQGTISITPSGVSDVTSEKVEGTEVVTVNTDIKNSEGKDGVSSSVYAKGETQSTEVNVKGDTKTNDPTINVVNPTGSSETDVAGVDLDVKAIRNGKTGSEANGSVVVDGDIRVANRNPSVTTADGLNVTATANTESEANAYAFVNGNVVVVNGDGIDVSVNTPKTDGEAEADVFVTGNVTATGKNTYGINVTTNDGGTAGNEVAALVVVGGTVSGTSAAVKVSGTDVPTIVVGELKSASGDLISANDEMYSQVIEHIYYMINEGENCEVVNGGTVLDNLSFLGTVANAGTYNSLTVKVASGYELTDVGGIADFKLNADGTYTVTVMDGGNLVFTAKLKYIPVAYSTTTSVTTNSMKGDKNSSTQPIMVVNMKASHFQKVMVDGTDLAESNFVTGAKENGLLTFQFSSSYIKSLAAGTYSLQFVSTENVTYTMKLVVAEDGTYTVSF